MKEHAYRGRNHGKRIRYVTDGELEDNPDGPFQTEVEALRSQDQDWGIRSQAEEHYNTYDCEITVFLASTHLPAPSRELRGLTGPDEITKRLRVSQIRDLAVIYHSGGGSNGSISIVDMQSLPGHVQTSEHLVVSIARIARIIRESDPSMPSIADVLTTTHAVTHVRST